MTVEQYLKSGRVVRLERDLRRTAVVTVDECGSARLDGDRFEAGPSDARGELPALRPEVVESMAARIESMLVAKVTIERLLITEGVAAHRFTCGDERNEWQETSVRIHMALRNERVGLRALIDLGGTSFEGLDLAEIADAAGALATASAAELRARGPIRLAPIVAAALASALGSRAPARHANVTLRQTAHTSAPVDGRGRIIAPLTLIGRDAQRPVNVYRPSYRVRGVPTPFHVELHRDGERAQREAAGTAFEAVALLAPPEITAGTITLRTLTSTGVVTLVKSPDEWLDTISAVDAQRRWYPHHAGALGSTMTIDDEHPRRLRRSSL